MVLMATTRLNTKAISDWQSFHEESRRAFGFPDFYGMNMNAWIDCLTHLNDGDGMSRFHLAKGETLEVEVSDADDFRSRLPEIFDALVDCSSVVNDRNEAAGKSPVLLLNLL
jgi:hypothetical protein